jgi:hypothetical protein
MADGQTILKYGDITIYRGEITEFDQRPEFDQSGTDLKCWVFSIGIVGYLHGLPSSGACVRHDVAGGAIRDGSATDAEKQVRWRLIPRQKFQLAVGCTSNITDGQTLLFAIPFYEGGSITTPTQLVNTRVDAQTGSGSVTGLSQFDVANGPKCTDFRIVHVAADNLFKVEARFEVHLVLCDDNSYANGNKQGILSHRWSCADTLDHNLRATRTYRGQLEIATAVFSPHWFRAVVVPPLNNGFRRNHMSFVATEDGRHLQYTVTDQEIAISAPPPARRWAVTHSESSVPEGESFVGMSTCSVTLEGDSNVDKMQLIELGVAVVQQKLFGVILGQPLGNQGILLGDITIVDHTGDVNMVQVSATAKTKLKTVGTGVVPRLDGFSKILKAVDLPGFCSSYDPRTSKGGRSGETPEFNGPAPLVGIWRCYLQSPCSDVHQVNNRTNQADPDQNIAAGSSQAADDDLDAVVVTSPSYLAPTSPSIYSASQAANSYTVYQCEGMYVTKTQRAAMPVAKAVYSGSGVDTSDATAIVQLTRPQSRYVLRIHGERTNAWPQMPDGESVGSSYSTGSQYATNNGGRISDVVMKLLQSKLMGGTTSKAASGQDVYRARSEFVFALNRAPTPTEVLKFGHNLWSTDNAGLGTQSTAELTNTAFP